MKKFLSSLVAVTFLASPVLAAEPSGSMDSKAAAQNAQNEKRIEETHTHQAKKKSKKAKKAKSNSTKMETESGSTGTAAPGSSK